MSSEAAYTNETISDLFFESSGNMGERRIEPVYGPWYLMQGYISGVPVMWTSRDPTVATEYPGGPPYPSPFMVVGVQPGK